MIRLGGHGDVTALPGPDSDGANMRLRAARSVLGKGIMQPVPWTPETLVMCGDSWLDTLPALWWQGKWNARQQQAALAQVDSILAIRRPGRVAGIVVGTEIEQYTTDPADCEAAAAAYCTDLATIVEHVAGRLPVYGPCIGSAATVGSDHDVIGRDIMAHCMSRLPAGVAGVAVNVYRDKVMHFDDPYFLMLDHVLPPVAWYWGQVEGPSTLLQAISCEFGTPVGWYWSQSADCYLPELWQAGVGVSNAILAAAYGVQTICWAHFPWDNLFDQSNQANLHNHTGQFVGPHNCGHCQAEAGKPRLIASAWAALGDLFRETDAGEPCIVSTDTAGALVSFAGASRDIYAVVNWGGKDPVSFAVESVPGTTYIEHDLISQATTVRYAADGIITLTATVLPAVISLPKGAVA